MEHWEEYKKLPNKLQLKTNIQFQELWNTHNPNFNKIKIFGKTCYSKRYQNCYGWSQKIMFRSNGSKKSKYGKNKANIY